MLVTGGGTGLGRAIAAALRDRGDDVVLLARRFLAEASAKAGRALELSADAERELLSRRWPGNVRQLQNEMQRVSALCDGPQVRADELTPAP